MGIFYDGIGFIIDLRERFIDFTPETVVRASFNLVYDHLRVALHYIR